jgi:dimethylargininase
VTGCLHLKSAVTSAGGSTLVINPAWVDPAHFAGFALIEVDPGEPAAANVLLIDTTVICAADHPRTRGRLESHGFVTASVPAAELARAEGGLTCCAVIVRR